MILLDEFSGYGGFSLGLEQAGFKFTKTYFSEKDKHCIANYRYNFPEAEYIGTVENVPGSGIKADIITFGSPCQDFSLAGKRKGLEGSRSSLIEYAIESVRRIRPSVFIWENVKGTFSSNAGADFWAIVQAFANIGGYRLQWQLLNTIQWIPQNRERIFLVGLAGKFSGCEVFPLGESDGRIDERATEAASVRCFTAGGNSGGHHSGMTLIRHRSDQPDQVGHVAPTIRNSDKSEVRILQRPRGFNKGGELSVCPTISGNDFVGLNPVMIAAMRGRNPDKPTSRKSGLPTELQAQLTTGGMAVQLTQKDYSKGNADAERVYDAEGTARTLKGEAGGGGAKMGLYEVGNSIRRLTPTECCRLQGLPDSWLKYGNYDGVIKEISDSQQYKMAGNGVSIPPVREIGKKLLLTSPSST